MFSFKRGPRRMRLRDLIIHCQIVAACCLVTGPARADDEWAVGLGGTHYSQAGNSDLVSFGFKHSVITGGEFIGVERTQFQTGSLLLLDLDAFQKPTADRAWSEGISVGTANVAPSRYEVYKVRLAFDASLNSHWSARAVEQYIKADAVYGNLLIVGIEFQPIRAWGVKLAAGQSFAGTLADRHGEFAIHCDGKVHVVAGLVVGTTGYDPIMLGERVTRSALREPYVGVSAALRGGTLSLSAESLRLGGSTRDTLRMRYTRQLRQ